MSVTDDIRRRVTSIHQLELTSRCSLRCTYCPSPLIVSGRALANGDASRAALDMDEATFAAALRWIDHFVRAGTQCCLNVAGIGESTMLPHFVEWVGRARKALGSGIPIEFANNGLHLNDGMAKALSAFMPIRCWVSLHRPEKAHFAVEAARRYGILAGVSTDPATFANDWAGQVAWKKPDYKLRCEWLAEGRAYVFADGRLSACCLDASGAGVFGSVQEDPSQAFMSSYKLCHGCHHHLPEVDRMRLVQLGAIR